MPCVVIETETSIHKVKTLLKKCICIYQYAVQFDENEYIDAIKYILEIFERRYL